MVKLGRLALASSTAIAISALAVLLSAQFGAFAQRAKDDPASGYGSWGFDLTGADFKTKAGDDFFRYGNGAWLDRTVIAPDRNSAGVSTELDNIAEARTRDILERGADGVEASARADAAKFGTFYANFMDEARAETLGARPIAASLQAIRAANTRDDIAELMGSGGQSWFSSIFGVSIAIDAKAPDKYAVNVSQSGLGLPDRDYYLTAQFAEKKAAYRAYVAQMLEMIGWERPQQSADAILAFETAIAEVSWPLSETRDSEKTYNPMSTAALASSAPFPWQRFFKGGSLDGLERVVANEVTAIPKIAALYAQAPVETLQAWLAFQLANSAAPYLSKRFVDANFAFRRRTLSGVAELPARWKRAVRTVSDGMGEAVGRVYVARYFAPEAKAQVVALVEQIRLAFGKRIERLDWMSAQTKAKALDKLARVGLKVAYPDKWRDYSKLDIRPGDLAGNVGANRKFEWRRNVDRLYSPVDRSEWGMTPQTVNAQYDSNLNEILLPAAQLQAPYFDPKFDAAVNYGGIGALIGHELTHGFDDDGRKYDGAGVLNDWWTEADAREFEARADVLGRQFDTYEPYPGAHVNGDLTMGENIADLGGALTAYDAYRHSLAGGTAPVLDGFTGDQRFFLSYAQGWRAKQTEDATRKQLVSDPHAPEQYRVNGVVRNMDAWYAAFGVKPEGKFYLPGDKRAHIW